MGTQCTMLYRIRLELLRLSDTCWSVRVLRCLMPPGWPAVQGSGASEENLCLAAVPPAQWTQLHSRGKVLLLPWKPWKQVMIYSGLLTVWFCYLRRLRRRVNKRQDADSWAEMEKKDDTLFKPPLRAVTIFWETLMTGRSIRGIHLFVLTFPGQVFFSCGLSCILNAILLLTNHQVESRDIMSEDENWHPQHFVQLRWKSVTSPVSFWRVWRFKFSVAEAFG